MPIVLLPTVTCLLESQMSEMLYVRAARVNEHEITTTETPEFEDMIHVLEPEVQISESHVESSIDSAPTHVPSDTTHSPIAR